MKPLLVCALVLAGCGGAHRDAGVPAPGPDAAPAVTLDEAGARETVAGLIEFLAAMAAVVEQRAGECDLAACAPQPAVEDCPCVPACDAMGADLEDLFTRTQPLFDLVHAAQVDPAANALLARTAEAHADEISPLSLRISVGLEACKANQKVFDAMSRMPEL